MTWNVTNKCRYVHKMLHLAWWVILVISTSHKRNIRSNTIIWFIKCIESGRHSRLRCRRPLDSIYIIGVFKFHLNAFITLRMVNVVLNIHSKNTHLKHSPKILTEGVNVLPIVPMKQTPNKKVQIYTSTSSELILINIQRFMHAL